ncbi:alpha/beta hydrolase [Mucilaginibacter sp.]|jgi:pimeloyl-ACP methyl ester carboxylesterase|uniref:alpha/beta fold hydrolase n=1 Tax=Mucilaginibacter sp. TaxID=1882438 RepID=UPI002BF22DA4|nr:alpha/beta hydrolase [Mucilaginibacter sp.]HTI61723.1 alpha/beta hydrolase [Mucilaginibacter sp.]
MKANLTLLICAVLSFSSGAMAAQPGTGIGDLKFRTAKVDGLTIFYREAGNPAKPAILLLHGFPSTSHMYDGLINDLAGKYHLIAPDYPGFGNSSKPDPSVFVYSFDHIAAIMVHFIETIGLRKFSLYMQDYGGPIGFRIASAYPGKINALIIQNANAYTAGLGDGFNKIMKMEQAGDEKGVANILHQIISLDGIKVQYTQGAANLDNIAPETYLTDFYYVQRPGNADIQATLFYDYHNNLTQYQVWQRYFKEHQPPALIVWGKNDPIFTAPGANAYRQDLPGAEIHLLNGGHFALVEYHREIAAYIISFLQKKALNN